ncbi:acyltransferase [Methylobacterium sp. BTF04]|uniref:acyltransferase family protein n=1 Tax=Methylobacterium sp. BTF04 TaxID=2708300 RepID=UPI0013D5D015|nr:acyltransferase [Methylobacterium sp. BTF04]NEU14473.1 acyltransferase [Methylobacterium sp. BTF04]
MIIVNIQALRAIAALLVIIVHCEVALKPLGEFHYITVAASSGVDLFFVISGFIMVHTTNGKTLTPVDFISNRFARVAPLYWLLTLIVFVLALVKPQLLGATKANFEYLAKSLSFIPYLRDDQRVAPILFLGWTLNYEIMFYVIFSICLYIEKWETRISVACAALVAVVAAGYFFDPINIPARFFTRPIILEFGLGMVIARFYHCLPNNPLAAMISIAVAIVALPLMLFMATWSLADLPLAGLPAAALVAAALTMDRCGVSLTWRPLILLGNASYSLYLIHPFVAQSIIKLSNIYYSVSITNSIVIIFIVYGISIITAVVVSRFIEVPMTRMIKRLLGIRRTSKADNKFKYFPK